MAAAPDRGPGHRFILRRGRWQESNGLTGTGESRAVGEATMETTHGPGHAAWMIVALVAALAAADARGGTAVPPAQQSSPEALPEAPPDDPRPWGAKVDPMLLREAVTVGGVLPCLVTFRETRAVALDTAAARTDDRRREWIAATAARLAEEFAPLGARMLRHYTFLPIARLDVPAEALPALASDPRVEGVTAIREVRAMRADGRALMSVPLVHAQGITGTGVGIAVLDSGVDYTHLELAPSSVKTIKLADTVNDDDDPMDDAGHGTSCAGIAAGLLGGVAPAATIVAVKVLDQEGKGTSDDVLEGIDAILASVNGGNPHNIRVANLSLGGYDGNTWPPHDGDCDAVAPDFVQAFTSLMDAGVLVVVAAGNGGCGNGVAWPACVSRALAVGAVYDAAVGARSYSLLNCSPAGCGDSLTAADIVTCYSDKGQRVDVWAPADCATTPTLGGHSEPCFGGTSAAAAYVSGTAALLAQAVPGITADELRAALRRSGPDVTSPSNLVTRKRVDAAMALVDIGGACAAPQRPGTPVGGGGTVCAGASVFLWWQPVPNAVSYKVQVAAARDFLNATELATTTAQVTYTPRLSTPAILYMRVVALSSCGTASPPSSTVEVNYNPDCNSPYGKVYHVSGVGHLRGVKPAFWYTDLALFNAGDAIAYSRLRFFGRTFTSGPVELALASHSHLTFTDVLPTLFGMATEDVGAITVESGQPLQVVARTYSRLTDACDGAQKTYGQSYEGVEPADALAAGQGGYLVSLRSDGRFRTNVEFVNAGSVDASVDVRVFNAGGAPLGVPLTLHVLPQRRAAITAALPAGQPSGYAEVRVSPAAARIVGFASVIDGASSDPTTIPMLVTGEPVATSGSAAAPPHSTRSDQAPADAGLSRTPPPASETTYLVPLAP